jgi:1-aminocyclopropane-1-carboxylate deaminase/D-cysteine desulfhydrase-like pyridoxal-dependent ACC family enzyme
VRNINALIIVGVSTNNSVEATARTAGNLGFQTQVVSDAAFAFDKVDFDGNLRTAAEVHAMSLANLQGEYAQVVCTVEALKHKPSKAIAVAFFLRFGQAGNRRAEVIPDGVKRMVVAAIPADGFQFAQDLMRSKLPGQPPPVCAQPAGTSNPWLEAQR